MAVAVESLVISSFFRGLSVRDVEAVLEDAFDQAVSSRSTVSRILEDTRERYRRWCKRRLEDHDHEFLERLIGAGVPAGTAELLIAREWSILAGETDCTTDTFQQITCRPPRPVAEFLHEYRAEFV